MTESKALSEARKRKEHLLLQAKQHLIKALDSTPCEEAIANTLSSLYADWSNVFDAEHRERITEQLQQASIEVRMQHFTGDSSYPTEHTISIGPIRGLGPTFDMALMDFVQKLLKEDHTMLKDLRDFMNGVFPGQDEREDTIRTQLLERVAKIIGEDE